MKWSWKIGKFGGIDVKIHATFAIIILWVLYNNIAAGDNLRTTIETLIFVLTIFTCVVLHEFGHALTARRYGIKTLDIILLPIGGLARLEKMPDDPKQELWVALAGPAVNVVIASIIFIILYLSGTALPLFNIDITTDSFLVKLMALNIILVLFNMLPAFPMDGGRVLRALLALKMEYMKSTTIASKIGKAMAILFGISGLYYLDNPFLLIIAVFVWFGANQEENIAKMRYRSSLYENSGFRNTSLVTLSPSDPIAKAVNLTLSGDKQDFAVMEYGKIVGVLRIDDLMDALSRGNINYLVKDIMRTDLK
ncbi:MAG: site-2 protease family protein [Candidatus Dadabacteria bacterium]|nr:site-2 protease family protein [Candidatus Dadabacteria bacterium]NIS09560.1 site-2 protease family protein [Candidatus Dadabacteria bacterium]NIV43069.1 site-2 protease family protein [Candidatus Dadabacteria bacterium]NIX16034.1 site-2 protease family protein [Candidatus Dadabacteria bacterium]NIY22737.1 site-2 protease family protein [Candidatus Dadabacteria bacterium]